MIWTTLAIDAERARVMSEHCALSPVLGILLSQRGLADVDACEAFLRPRLAQLRDPFELSQMDAAVARIEQAINAAESILVFGDYDVDGVTSTVQLVHLLRLLGTQPRFTVPRRMDEGYGLSREAIDRAFAGEVPDLFIALDCGTNAHEPIAYLRALGVEVIVVDHHQVKAHKPEDCIFVNPHAQDGPDEPWRHLCTAGLVFKLLHGLLKRRRQQADPRVDSIQLKDYLDLVAMGTLADLVPQVGENRLLSWYGLQHLRANGRMGVRALAEVSGLEASQQISGGDIAFKLGPRINASGRLADASLPIDLLLSQDAGVCKDLAQQLDRMNRERQAIERTVAQEAEAQVLERFMEAPGIVLFDPNWHSGVVGIVASRVSRRFHKPCVVLGADDGMARGSGRSVPSVDLVRIFQLCSDTLEHWGGHPMAAGLSLSVEQVPAFTDCFLQALREAHPQGLPEPTLELSCWIELEDLSVEFLQQLERLQPYGQANPEPLFGIKSVVLDQSPSPFGEGNFRFHLPMGSKSSRHWPGIAWRMESVPPVGQPIDCAIRFGWNFWRGQKMAQVTLVDWRRAY